MRKNNAIFPEYSPVAVDQSPIPNQLEMCDGLLLPSLRICQHAEPKVRVQPMASFQGDPLLGTAIFDDFPIRCLGSDELISQAFSRGTSWQPGKWTLLNLL